MPELEKYFDLQNIQEVFPRKISRIDCDGKIYYLKRRLEKKFWRKKAMKLIQNGLVLFLGLRELAPTANVRRASSYEPKKIIDLGRKGLSVPEVLYYNDDYFIMTDCGETLQRHIKRHPEKAEQLLSQAMSQLAELHNCGDAHGGAQVRNFAVRDGQVTMFDFEEIIPEKYCENIQFRDILVFLISLSRDKSIDINYRELLKHYEECAAKKGRTKKIFDLAKRFRWLGRVCESRYAKLFGKDVYRISILVRQLHKADQTT